MGLPMYFLNFNPSKWQQTSFTRLKHSPKDIHLLVHLHTHLRFISVTLAWDSVDENFEEVIVDLGEKYVTMNKTSYIATSIAVSLVGPYGTVIRGSDLAQFQLPSTTSFSLQVEDLRDTP